MSTDEWRIRRQDVVLAAAVAFFQVVGEFFASDNPKHHSDGKPLDAVAVILLLIGPLLLLVRRRWPGGVLVGVFAATITFALLNYRWGPLFIALIFAYFNAIFARRRAVAYAVLLAGYLGFMLLVPWVRGTVAVGLAGYLGLGAWLLVLTTGSEFIRARIEAREAERRRIAEERRSLTEQERRRAGEERLLIAQELHDVLAHHISLISVQAGVGLELMDETPEQARTSLTAIRAASKEALGELRSVLEVLRAPGTSAPRRPTGGLAGLEKLVEQTAAAGISVRLVRTGTARTLPAPIDLAAFRIVQEALTNVVRHSGASAARITVDYGDDTLTVRVDDEGLGMRANGTDGGGNGLPGMRERAAALGGRLVVGPSPHGGVRVEARLPIGGAR